MPLYDQSRRVYGVHNLSPTINTMGGGEREIKVLIVYEDDNRMEP